MFICILGMNKLFHKTFVNELQTELNGETTKKLCLELQTVLKPRSIKITNNPVSNYIIL